MIAEQYLWDRTGSIDPEIAALERLLAPLGSRARTTVTLPLRDAGQPRRRRRRHVTWLAAAVACGAALAWLAALERRMNAEPPTESRAAPAVTASPLPEITHAPAETIDPQPPAPPRTSAAPASVQPDDAPNVARKKKRPRRVAATGSSPVAAVDDAKSPENLTADQIKQVLAPLAPDVKACARRHGVEPGQKIVVYAQVEGATGRVTDAATQAPHRDHPVAACVAGVIRQAKFPRFARPKLAVIFPYGV